MPLDQVAGGIATGPVANPISPLSVSISTRMLPSTPMPQLSRESAIFGVDRHRSCHQVIDQPMACRATVIVAAHFRLVQNIGPKSTIRCFAMSLARVLDLFSSWQGLTRPSSHFFLILSFLSSPRERGEGKNGSSSAMTRMVALDGFASEFSLILRERMFGSRSVTIVRMLGARIVAVDPDLASLSRSSSLRCWRFCPAMSLPASSGRDATPEALALLRTKLHLNDPAIDPLFQLAWRHPAGRFRQCRSRARGRSPTFWRRACSTPCFCRSMRF